jgi:hypothetical protein
VDEFAFGWGREECKVTPYDLIGVVLYTSWVKQNDLSLLLLTFLKHNWAR